MDVNGTRLHLLLGAGDWQRCRDDHGVLLGDLWNADPPAGDVSYDLDRDELSLTASPFRFPSSGVAPLDLAGRRGAARDRYGNWYWIDAVPATILVRSAGNGRTTPFWSAGQATATPPRPGSPGFEAAEPAAPPAPLRLSGAAVTSDHYLVAGVIEPAGLLVFDLYAGGPPQQVRWPAPFRPHDMAARPDGGVVILDRANRRYWELDSHLLVIAYGDGTPGPDRSFRPVTGDDAGRPLRVSFRPPAAADAVAVAGGDPVAVDVLPDGTVLVLVRHGDDAPSAVHAYRHGTPIGTADLTMTGYDLAVAEALYVVDGRGDQAFAFTVDTTGPGLRLTVRLEYYPMRLFSGKGLVAAGGQPYYDTGPAWVPLVGQPQRRYRPAGEVRTGPLDGERDGCVWHRVLIDACLPSETSIEVFSAASDDQDAPADPLWRAEPLPYARGDGSEQPVARRDPAGGYRTWELLLQAATGRYLRLRLRLTGNERSSPRIRAVRVHYPRFSYLERYLPATYRDDVTSASFLDRFLANAEGIATTVEGRIAAAHLFFDPAVAPPESLDWLASWFDLALDPAWDDATRRLLITNAMEFLRWRGTVHGIGTALALALEPHPDLFAAGGPACARRARIVEMYQTRTDPATPAVHRFRVLLPVAVPSGTADEDERFDRDTRMRLAQRIVELEKPAHTVFDVKFYWDAFRVGEARLGLDTLIHLGNRSPSLGQGVVLGRAYLGESRLAGPTTADRIRDRRMFRD
jgi:phage tail-like protein